MGALRLLLVVVPVLYCVSVLALLLRLPSLQLHLSHLSKLDQGLTRHNPPIHDHVLVARMAQQRCANLSRQRTAANGANWLRFVTIPRTQISLLTAYRDDRLPHRSYIRLLVLMNTARRALLPPLFCHLPLAADHMLSVAATPYQFNENHGMPFGGYIYSCPLPSDLSTPEVPLCMLRVTKGPLHQSPGVEMLLEKVPRPGPVFNLTMCVPPMFGAFDAKRLVEFVELNRLLGFEHFYLYDIANRTGSDVELVLEHYRQAGIITLWRWKLPVADANVWYNGQMLAIHHCLYANMGVSQYTAFQDFDEVFVPRQHDDLQAMLRSIDAERRHCGFRFFSAFFPKPEEVDGTGTTKLFSLRHRRSSVSRLRTKCIVHAELMFEMGIHHMSKQNIEEMRPQNVPEDVVLLHHNRVCDPSYGLNCHVFEEDDAIVRRFGRRLTKRYEQAVRTVLPR